MITLTNLENLLTSAQRHPNDAHGQYLLDIARTYALAIIASELTKIRSQLSPLSQILSEAAAPTKQEL